MASDMFLYWGSGSPPSWKLMIVLDEKEFKGYKNKLLSFEKKENKSEEVLKLNPRGQVPTFRIGSTVINESNAACQYLESEFPNQGTKLIPDDPAQKAKVLQLMYESPNLQTAAQGYIGYLLSTKKEEQDPEKVKTKKEALVKELQLWENVLSKNPQSSYLAGKDFSMADAAFFPMLAFMFRNCETIADFIEYIIPCLSTSLRKQVTNKIGHT